MNPYLVHHVLTHRSTFFRSHLHLNVPPTSCPRVPLLLCSVVNIALHASRLPRNSHPGAIRFLSLNSDRESLSNRQHLKPVNLFIDILLRTLCRSPKTQLLCNQPNPNSLCKTPGWGVPSALNFDFRVSSFVSCRPFVFMVLRIAFSASPLLSQTSALPYVFLGVV